MLINKLSKLSGLSRDTIRFYEKVGLIKTTHVKRLLNMYKDYSSETLEQLLVIKDLKESGFTLNEIKDMAHLYSMDPHSCSDNVPKIKQKLEDVDAKIKALKKMRSKLAETASCCETGCPDNCGLDKSLSVL